MLDLSFCNELLAADGLDFDAQCAVARDLGYAGLELAPATLGEAPHRLPASEVLRIREAAERHGLGITGLHWLLAGHPEASITEPQRHAATSDILRGLVDLCADLGGGVLVHGSPGQRRRPTGLSDADLFDLLAGFFRPIAAHAAARGVLYCIEPLSRAETNVINTHEDATRLAELVGEPAFCGMIDTSAAGQTEPPVAKLVERGLARGTVGHIHLNDTNRGAPGMGDDPFPGIVAAILKGGWDRPVTIEPFRTCLDARVTAAIGIATIRACERAAA